MPALETLSLAVNKITTLRDLQYCFNLRVLSMRGNKLNTLAEIPRYLGGLQQLRQLSLNENPFCEHPRYRQFVVKALPQLEDLDGVKVSSEERRKVEGVGLEELLGGAGEVNVSPTNNQAGISPSKPKAPST